MDEHINEIRNNIMKRDDSDRYRFFIEKIVDTEEVWMLSQEDNLVTMETENGKEFIPVWAIREMAEANNKDVLSGSEPVSIDLPFFMNEILDNAIKRKDVVGPNYDIDTNEYDCPSQRLMKRAINLEIKKKINWYRNNNINSEEDIVSPIDYESLLAELRVKYKTKADEENFVFDPPYWMQKKDPLHEYFKSMKQLKVQGKVLYAYIYKCDESLFDRYPREDKPAVIIFSEDPEFEKNPDNLRQFGEKIEILGASDIIHDSLRPLYEMLSENDPRPMNIMLPSAVSRDKKIYLTTILVHKKFLPQSMLSRRIIPVVADIQNSKNTTLLGSSYWPTEYRKYYDSFSEVDISHKKEPEQNEKNIKKNDRILNMNDSEKYNFFVKRVCEAEEVWTLIDDGSPAGFEQDNCTEIFLFWPTEELATMNRTEFFKEFFPHCISVYEFAAKWLPVINKRKDEIMLFYYKKNGLYADAVKLKKDLERELDNYDE